MEKEDHSEEINRKMNRSSIFAALFIISFSFSACNFDSTFEEDIDFNEGTWHMDTLAVFEFESEKVEKNIEIKLRSNLDYPFYNLYLKLELIDSLGRRLQDTLLGFDLYDQKTGKPIGKGNSIYQLNAVALPNYEFPYEGKYEIRLAQYMRRATLPGILSAGIRIEDPTQ